MCVLFYVRTDAIALFTYLKSGEPCRMLYLTMVTIVITCAFSALIDACTAIQSWFVSNVGATRVLRMLELLHL
mgnify:CR=1 FL=1